MVLSKAPDAIRVPSGEKTTDEMMLERSPRVFKCAPLTASHSRMVLSKAPDAMRVPSGEKTTDEMMSE